MISNNLDTFRKLFATIIIVALLLCCESVSAERWVLIDQRQASTGDQKLLLDADSISTALLPNTAFVTYRVRYETDPLNLGRLVIKHSHVIADCQGQRRAEAEYSNQLYRQELKAVSQSAASWKEMVFACDQWRQAAGAPQEISGALKPTGATTLVAPSVGLTCPSGLVYALGSEQYCGTIRPRGASCPKSTGAHNLLFSTETWCVYLAHQTELVAELESAKRRQRELEERLAADRAERERMAAESEDRAPSLANANQQDRVGFAPPVKPSVYAYQPERRVALVIGNANYRVSPLENPVNDAVDIDAALRKMGFETTLLRNATLTEMREATRRFADQLPRADVALIYFAGHGIESRGRNFMIPVDAELKFEFELIERAYDAGVWLDMLEGVKSSNADRVNIVILDACRNNTLLGSRSLGRGLGRLDAPAGTFLAYSTAPGQVAADGPRGQRNSPFTKHLLRAMEQTNFPIEEVFKEVRRNVRSETGGAQVPWESTSLTGFFAFRRIP
jgi:hypothetical protein